MEKIRFIKDKDKIYKANVNINENIASVLFSKDVPLDDVLISGFDLLNEYNGRVHGQYHNYKTIYKRHEDNAKLFELSNDGSVYAPTVTFYTDIYGTPNGMITQVANNYEELVIPTPDSNENYIFREWNPKIPTSGKIKEDVQFRAVFDYIPTVTFTAGVGGAIEDNAKQVVNRYEELVIPTPVINDNHEFVGWNPEIPADGVIPSDMTFEAMFNYIPTAEELAATLKYNKSVKISESKTMLTKYLAAHPLKSTCHNGVVGYYNITSEKQTLMNNNYFSYSIAKQAGIEAELTWNETGKESEVWTEEEFLQLIMEVQAFVKPMVALQQKYEVMINACKTQEELDAIVIAYCSDNHC